MKTLILIYIFSIISALNFAKANDIHWANKVISKSVKSNINHGRQILGEPNTMPDFGESSCSWSPERYKDKPEWIIIGFDSTINMNFIYIYENVNPGAITSITVFDQFNVEKQVYTNNNPIPIIPSGRILKIDIRHLKIKSNSLKIEVSLMNYYGKTYQIDAVGVSEKNIDYQVEINNIKDFPDVQPQNLGPNVNTKFNEVAPIITSSGKRLYFTRQDDTLNYGDARLQDIYFSELDSNNKFTMSKNIGPPLNNNLNNFVISILPDENQIIVGNIYLAEYENYQGFSLSTFNGSEWSIPQPIKIDDFKNYVIDCSYSLAASGRTMILSIAYKGCRGKHDLYVSFKNDDGVWSAPLNMGPTINNFGDEISPYLAADNLTLYFSTDGYPGYGNSDIFVTRRLDDSWCNWSKPLNLGPKLNSKGWDAYYTIPASGNFAYFVSSLNSIGGTDIFRVVLPESAKPKPVALISGKVFDNVNNKAIKANIYYETLPEGQKSGTALSNELTGDYKIALPTGKKYGYLAEAEGYISINQFIDLTDVNSYTEIVNDLELVPINKDMIIRLNNIFFETGKYNLLKESFPELNRVVKLLKKNPKIKIKVLGHTDSVGTTENNLTLSNNRALSVVKYIEQKGIDINRLKYEGYGELKPISDNSTVFGRRKNRRVEFVIIEN